MTVVVRFFLSSVKFVICVIELESRSSCMVRKHSTALCLAKHTASFCHGVKLIVYGSTHSFSTTIKQYFSTKVSQDIVISSTIFWHLFQNYLSLISVEWYLCSRVLWDNLSVSSEYMLFLLVNNKSWIGQ